MVCGRGSDRSQLKSVGGADRARLCGHVKLSLLNSADYQEYPDRKEGAGPAQQAMLSDPANPTIHPIKTFELNL